MDVGVLGNVDSPAFVTGTLKRFDAGRLTSTIKPMPIVVPKNRPPTTPGEIIQEEFLVPLDMSQAELARSMNVPTNRISQLISGKRALTAETALRLEAVLGIDAGTWMNLQTACDIWNAKKVTPTRGLRRLEALKTA